MVYDIEVVAQSLMQTQSIASFAKKVRLWLESREHRKYRFGFLLILLILFGDIIPYRMVPPPDLPINGIRINTVQIPDVRPTANQPSTYADRILMFGNSALQAFYLPPEETIASYLQAHFRNSLVINMAVGGANTNSELLKLMDTPLMKGDTIVFYDGTNEATGSNTKRPICSIPIGIVALLCAHTPATLDPDSANSVISDVKRALKLAKIYSEARGATFIHIFQPVCLRQGNPFDDAYRQMVARLTSVDNTTINMAYFLGCYNDYFYDFGHTRPLANQMIADEIYDRLFAVF